MILALAALILAGTGRVCAKAAEAKPVGVAHIDYELLTLTLDCGGNSIIYLSSDNKKWEELDVFISNEKADVDISWVSQNSEQTLYFKGNVDDTVEEVTLPAKDTKGKIKYNKADDDFEFENFDEADSFQWRKSSNYNWTTVSLDTSGESYKAFAKKVESFRTQGAKLVFRSAPVDGTSASEPGMRPGKEITVSIPKRDAAPSLTVNIRKTVANTKDTMEYYDEKTGVWKECDTNMSVFDFAPETAYAKGGKDASVKIRVAANEKKSYSKTAVLLIKGQGAAPVIGDATSEMSHYIANKKLVLQFPKASKENVYEYYIDQKGNFDPETASWKQVKNGKNISISQSKAPEGTVIYIRKAGTPGSSKKGTVTTLASAYASFKVSFR